MQSKRHGGIRETASVATRDAVHETLVALRDWFFSHLDLEEVIQSLPEQDRPAPPPPPIRIMLTLSWRKQWAAKVTPLLV